MNESPNIDLMNVSCVSGSTLNYTSTYGKNDTKIEELTSTLEIFIECLSENSQNFIKLKKPTKFELEEFMLEYINLEDKILNCFNQLSSFKLKKSYRARIDELIQAFNCHWKEFQDGWNDKMWVMYEGIRNSEERYKLISFEEDEEYIQSERNSCKEEDTIDPGKNKTFISCEIKTIFKNYSTNASSFETERNLEKIDNSLMLINTQVEHKYLEGNQTDNKDRGCLRSCSIL